MTSLTPRLLQLALYCARQEHEARIAGKPPGAATWNAELVRALELEVAVSSTRQKSVGGESESEHDDNNWIGAGRAAELLRWDIRQVQRRATDLDGRKVGGRWFFRESAVIEYREALNDDRTVA